MSDQSKRIGAIGEDLAAGYLERNDYQIRERNYRVRIGELDIIAEKDGTLVFVEVKTRRSLHCGTPAESVSRYKQKKIIQVAQIFLRQKQLTGCSCRFDVIEVYVRAEGTWKIRHLKGAFEA